jgi:hypothetical protein
VTLTAMVTSNVGTPTGAIIFYDGTTAISPWVALTSAGAAVYVINSLISGTHSIFAKYSGSSSFPAAVSSSVMVTVGAVAPQIGVSPQSGTIGVTVFIKSGTGFTPNGPITHIATWPDNSATLSPTQAKPKPTIKQTPTTQPARLAIQSRGRCLLLR